MPPFVPANCPHCQKANTFDWLDLKANKPGARVFRSVETEETQDDHIFVVTCKHCSQSFKIKVPEPGGRNG